MNRWRDRGEAGQELAEAVEEYEDEDVIVYGLPRGGVVLAAEVAKALGAPLSLIIPRKIGHRFNPEYAVGAVTEHGEACLNKAEITDKDKQWVDREIERQRREAARRRQLYLEGKEPLNAKGKTAIIVDDGVATGYTLRAAIAEIKTHKPQKIIVAVPVIPEDTAHDIEHDHDVELMALKREDHFMGAVGNYYEYFEQVEDAEVIDLLASADH